MNCSPPTASAPRLLAFCLLLLHFLLAPNLDAGPKPSATPTQPPTILVLGDSLAAGHGLEPSEAFPALLQQKIDELGWNFQVINAGVSGDTTAGGLRRINWLLKRKADVLLLELGGNDGLRGIDPDTTKANLQSIIKRAREKYPEIHVILAGMQMPPNMGAEFTARFQQIFPEVARESNAALVPFLLEGVGGKREFNQADMIHPTARGQEIIADNVWTILKPLLESLAQPANQPAPAATP